MGCDAFADENGEFELIVEDYETGRGELERIKITGLKPKHKLSIDVIKGRER